MEEHSLYTHYLSCRKDVPDRELSENTKKIIALVESKNFLEANRYVLSDIYRLMEIVYSARADVRYKLELLNGIMAEFKDTKQWEYRGKNFMQEYEPFKKGIDLMKSADGISFILTTVSRDEKNVRSYHYNYPEFSSVEEISQYLASLSDSQNDSKNDSEWYIAKRHVKNIPEWHQKNLEQTAWYLLSKCGIIWKYGIPDGDGDIETVGDRIYGTVLQMYGEILTIDKRPFKKVFHAICCSDGGEDYALYVENGMLTYIEIECECVEFEDFSFALRVAVFEGNDDELTEEEHILAELRDKYNSLSKKDGYKMLQILFAKVLHEGMDGMPLKMVRKFIKKELWRQ